MVFSRGPPPCGWLAFFTGALKPGPLSSRSSLVSGDCRLLAPASPLRDPSFDVPHAECQTALNHGGLR